MIYVYNPYCNTFENGCQEKISTQLVRVLTEKKKESVIEMFPTFSSTCYNCHNKKENVLYFDRF